MTTAVIIQARMGSTRLPGKVLEDLGGRTVLSHVIERCQILRNADVVCCAVPKSADSDPVAAEAERCGAVVFRGSENDVLDRYFQAAVSLDANVIVRVTSDCPMIDPDVVAQVIELLKDSDADFSTNNLPPSWPHGLDCEAMTVEWLTRAWKEAVEPMDREHVSPFIRRHPDARIVNLEGPGGSLTDHRWTLDYPEDLVFLRALFAVLPSGQKIPGLEQILGVLKAHPEIAAINEIHKTVTAGKSF
ncbi:MAG: glycosyltransferase family protein [Proteobacteria bacterium]|nr:glycosyltransferase family protein [Pseudomonadota bacterium]